MSASKHAPTPWYAANWTCHEPRTVLVDDASVLTGKRIVAECARDEDAAYIVKAANSHEQLVAALKLVQHEVGGTHPYSLRSYLPTEVIVRLELALAAAESP